MRNGCMVMGFKLQFLTGQTFKVKASWQHSFNHSEIGAIKVMEEAHCVHQWEFEVSNH